MRDGEDEKILQNDIARVSFMIQAQAARGGPPRCARGSGHGGQGRYYHGRRYRQSGGCASGIAAATRRTPAPLETVHTHMGPASPRPRLTRVSLGMRARCAVQRFCANPRCSPSLRCSTCCGVCGLRAPLRLWLIARRALTMLMVSSYPSSHPWAGTQYGDGVQQTVARPPVTCTCGQSVYAGGTPPALRGSG